MCILVMRAGGNTTRHQFEGKQGFKKSPDLSLVWFLWWELLVPQVRVQPFSHTGDKPTGYHN